VIEIDFELGEVAAVAKRFGAASDQLPYILATSLNNAAEETRKVLIDAWPSYVKVRNESFIAASLTTRHARATKENLSVMIYDKLGRGHLKLLAEGGVRGAVGQNIAIPVGQIRAQRGSRGVPQDLRPRRLVRSFVKNGKLFRVLGRGKATRIQVAYLLRPQAKIPKTVPFYQLFANTMNRALVEAIPRAVVRAMASRR